MDRQYARRRAEARYCRHSTREGQKCDERSWVCFYCRERTAPDRLHCLPCGDMVCRPCLEELALEVIQRIETNPTEIRASCAELMEINLILSESPWRPEREALVRHKDAAQQRHRYSCRSPVLWSRHVAAPFCGVYEPGDIAGSVIGFTMASRCAHEAAGLSLARLQRIPACVLPIPGPFVSLVPVLLRHLSGQFDELRGNALGASNEISVFAGRAACPGSSKVSPPRRSDEVEVPSRFRLWKMLRG